MLLVDRYVFSLFMRVFVLCFLSLAGIYIVGDFVGNLQEFIDASDRFGGILPTVIRYYGVRVPWFFDLIGCVVSLIAAVFAVTWLQRNNEMTALMAAGISRWRILRPVVIGAVLISLFGLVNREAIIPTLREELAGNIRDWDSDQASDITARFDHMTNILIDGDRGFEKKRRITNPTFRLPLSMAHFGRQLIAKSAVRRRATPELPAGYVLSEVSVPKNIDELDPVQLEGRPVIYTRRNADWLKPGQCFVVSNVSFGQLIGGRAWRQHASTGDLISGLNNPSMDFGADVRVAIHARLVRPFLDVTLLFLGLPIVLARESRNVFVAAGSCVVVVTIFFVVSLAAHSLGMNYLVSPAQAAWMPLMIFVPWAVAASNPLRR